MCVYVITPSLNKSFKFQSDWPYNNSQIYLLSSLLDDITADDKKTFEESDKGYIFTTKVNYPNNSDLIKQMIYMDKKLKFTEVRVVDKDNNTEIKMKFNKITYDKNYNEDYFNLNSILEVIPEQSEKKEEQSNDTESDNNVDEQPPTDETVTNSSNKEEKTSNEQSTKEESKETATIDDVIYPMYLPTNTYLKEQEKVNTTSGQRLILTFEGDSPFTLVEETVAYSKEHEIIPTFGELEILLDTIAVVNDNSVNWISNGIEYYVVSDTMPTSEILEIAKSISVLPVSK